LLEPAVAGRDKHDLLARKVGLFHVRPKRRRRAEHPGSRHQEEAANRIEIDRFNLDARQLSCIRIRDGLSLT
jgi:hypothetical protein